MSATGRPRAGADTTEQLSDIESPDLKLGSEMCKLLEKWISFTSKSISVANEDVVVYEKVCFDVSVDEKAGKFLKGEKYLQAYAAPDFGVVFFLLKKGGTRVLSVDVAKGTGTYQKETEDIPPFLKNTIL